jgi:hypothetical protein
MPKVTWTWLLATLALVAVGVGAALVVHYYGGGNFWPGLVTGFIGTLVAFVLALSWERHRERQRLEQNAVELRQQRATEVRRRLEPVRTELETNAESLRIVANALRPTGGTSLEPTSTSRPAGDEVFTFVNPQLLEGAWIASAPRLSELVSDYKLIADLATAYGRIEELRWRLRYRTEHRAEWLDTITVGLVEELGPKVDDLLERVARQINEPSVQPLGLAHTKA